MARPCRLSQRNKAVRYLRRCRRAGRTTAATDFDPGGRSLHRTMLILGYDWRMRIETEVTIEDLPIPGHVPTARSRLPILGRAP